MKTEEEFPLSLSTTVKPARKFLVDGAEYEMLGTDHLSPEDEALVLAWFSRHNILTMELDRERNVAKGKVIASRQRDARVSVIVKLTTLPKDVVEALPLSQQVKLLEALEVEINREDEVDEEETSEPAAEAAELGADD